MCCNDGANTEATDNILNENLAIIFVTLKYLMSTNWLVNGLHQITVLTSMKVLKKGGFKQPNNHGAKFKFKSTGDLVEFAIAKEFS